MTKNAEYLVKDIKETREDFVLVHSGFVISPDSLTLKTATPVDKKCKSAKS